MRFAYIGKVMGHPVARAPLMTPRSTQGSNFKICTTLTHQFSMFYTKIESILQYFFVAVDFIRGQSGMVTV